jgi:hypothetical protein
MYRIFKTTGATRDAILTQFELINSGIPSLNQHAMIDVVADVTALRLKFQFRSGDSSTRWRLSM